MLRLQFSGTTSFASAVDFMKINWNNFPHAWKCQYHNSKDRKLASIQVEDWFDHSLYICHYSTGRCGTKNYITVMEYSPLLTDIHNGTFKLEGSNRYKFNGSDRERTI